jgi:hypothetical protein
MPLVNGGITHGWISSIPPEPKPIFLVNRGTIYDVLHDPKFSIFMKMVQKTHFLELLNDPKAKVTLLVVPDAGIPQEVQKQLLQCTRAETTAIIGAHIFDLVRGPDDLFAHQVILPTRNPKVKLTLAERKISLFLTGSLQTVTLTTNGNLFINGYVYCISEPIIP